MIAAHEAGRPQSPRRPIRGRYPQPSQHSLQRAAMPAGWKNTAPAAQCWRENESVHGRPKYTGDYAQLVGRWGHGHAACA